MFRYSILTASVYGGNSTIKNKLKTVVIRLYRTCNAFFNNMWDGYLFLNFTWIWCNRLAYQQYYEDAVCPSIFDYDSKN